MSDLSRLEALLDETALHHEIAALEASLPIGVRPRQLRHFAPSCSGPRVVSLTVVPPTWCACTRRSVRSTRPIGGASECSSSDAVSPTCSPIARWSTSTTSLRERSRTTSPTGSPVDRLQCPRRGRRAPRCDWPTRALFLRPRSTSAHLRELPPTRRAETASSADPEAAWGHRRGGGPGEKSALFFGHYANLATMVNDEHGRRGPRAGATVDPQRRSL